MTILTDALLKKDLVSREQLNDAIEKQIGAKKPIHELLSEMGFVKEDDIIKVSSEIFGMPVLNLEREDRDPTLIKLIPYEKAKRYGVFPVRKENNVLVVAMSDPQDVIALDDLALMTGCGIKAVLISKSQINRYIEEFYQSDESIYDLLKNIVSDGDVRIIKEEVSGRQSTDLGDFNTENSPIVRLSNLIMSDALKNRASDIHIEPREGFTEVRYRIDGDLRNIMKIPVKLQEALSARVKIVAELDIAEKRKTQDGRTRIMVNDKKVDLRVSVLPTFYGEKIVIRLLDTKEAQLDLDRIGFRKKELDVFKAEISRNQGMVLVTGPTGTGKTSTLYSALGYIKSERKNIVTIENPIEYLMEGINQVQVNPSKDITFANTLRSILRQDPNVIFVGEIRDRETADIAFRASQTGHLVFSTLHTNSAVATITRLIDIGLEPFLIASSVNLVIAQRLVKRICQNCKEVYIPEEKEKNIAKAYSEKFPIREFCRGRGCEQCGYTGFRGRAAVFEILKIDEDIRALVSGRAAEDVILKEARRKGMMTLDEAAFEKVAQGVTTLEEAANAVDITYQGDISEDIPDAVKVVPGGRAKILVADDEVDIRKVLKKRLEIAGYDVITAVNGVEALRLATREKPDLILMDVMMPEMDGFAATRALRSNLETAVIPVLMLTAKKDKQSELEGMDAGADDYVTKPFDKDKLLARIRMLLRRVS